MEWIVFTLVDGEITKWWSIDTVQSLKEFVHFAIGNNDCDIDTYYICQVGENGNIIATFSLEDYYYLNMAFMPMVNYFKIMQNNA